MKEASGYRWWIPKKAGEVLEGTVAGWMKDTTRTNGGNAWFVKTEDGALLRVCTRSELIRKLETVTMETGGRSVFVRIETTEETTDDGRPTLGFKVMYEETRDRAAASS